MCINQHRKVSKLKSLGGKTDRWTVYWCQSHFLNSKCMHNLCRVSSSCWFFTVCYQPHLNFVQILQKLQQSAVHKRLSTVYQLLNSRNTQMLMIKGAPSLRSPLHGLGPDQFLGQSVANRQHVGATVRQRVLLIQNQPAKQKESSVTCATAVGLLKAGDNPAHAINCSCKTICKERHTQTLHKASDVNHTNLTFIKA